MQEDMLPKRRASLRLTSQKILENRRKTVKLQRIKSEWMRSNSFEVWKEHNQSFQALVRSDSADMSCCSISHSSDSASSTTRPKFRLLTHSIATLLSPRSPSLRPQPSLPPSDECLLLPMVIIRDLTPFEVIDECNDHFPLLEIRKAVRRLWQGVRQLCRLAVNNSLFQVGIIVAILVNTVLLAMEDPSLTTQPEPYQTMELVLLYIYTGEMILKQIGLGLISTAEAYFRENWNLLDFVVVVTSWLDIYTSGSGVNLAALRALRILRPLRSITRIKGMKLVFTALLSSARALLSSITLLLFFYLITSIAALQMFMGVLKHRCMDIDTGFISSDSLLCGGAACPSGYVCVSSLNNPNFGKSNFDNVLMSMLTLFQSVTLEGWTPVRIYLEKGFSIYAVLFFVPVVYLGAFFFNNMTLVAMKSAVGCM